MIIIYFQKPAIVSQQEEIFYGFEAGTHKIPFSFHLPASGLHTSFAARKCNTTIKYGVIVELIKNHEITHHDKADFSVVTPIPVPMGLHSTKEFKSIIDLSK